MFEIFPIQELLAKILSCILGAIRILWVNFNVNEKYLNIDQTWNYEFTLLLKGYILNCRSQKYCAVCMILAMCDGNFTYIYGARTCKGNAFTKFISTPHYSLSQQW